MPINARFGCVFLSASADVSQNNYAISLAYPEGIEFESVQLSDAGRNERGTMTGRLIGREQYKITLNYDKISCQAWWTLRRWLKNRFSFYCHFFNYDFGEWQTLLCYRSSTSKITPRQISFVNKEPSFIEKVSISFIDCGVI